MKAYKQMEVYLHSFLTPALYGSIWLTSRPGRFIPGTEPLYPLNTKRVDPGAGVDVLEKRKTSCPFRTPDRPARSLVAVLITLHKNRWHLIVEVTREIEHVWKKAGNRGHLQWRMTMERTSL